jgi:hypothetical protein
MWGPPPSAALKKPPPDLFYTCKNFRIASKDPPTPMSAPVPQKLNKIVFIMER